MHLNIAFLFVQVGVLCPLGRNIYLNITSSNLVRFYTRREGTEEQNIIAVHTVGKFALNDFKGLECDIFEQGTSSVDNRLKSIPLQDVNPPATKNGSLTVDIRPRNEPNLLKSNFHMIKNQQCSANTLSLKSSLAQGSQLTLISSGTATSNHLTTNITTTSASVAPLVRYATNKYAMQPTNNHRLAMQPGTMEVVQLRNKSIMPAYSKTMSKSSTSCLDGFLFSKDICNTSTVRASLDVQGADATASKNKQPQLPASVSFSVSGAAVAVKPVKEDHDDLQRNERIALNRSLCVASSLNGANSSTVKYSSSSIGSIPHSVYGFTLHSVENVGLQSQVLMKKPVNCDDDNKHRSSIVATSAVASGAKGIGHIREPEIIGATLSKTSAHSGFQFKKRTPWNSLLIKDHQSTLQLGSPFSLSLNAVNKDVCDTAPRTCDSFGIISVILFYCVPFL